MNGYVQVSLKEMLLQLSENNVKAGEDRVKSILSSFSCPYNLDVEGFLKSTAIEFSRQSIAATHLVFTSYKDEMVLIGYYTLALKDFCVSTTALSNTLRKKIVKFGTYDKDIKKYKIPAPLIAQLGKNFYNGYNNLITGDELLYLACQKVALVQQEIGGKVVYLECEDKPKLLDFYSSNGFVNFGKRRLEKDEAKTMMGEYLIQMLKII